MFINLHGLWLLLLLSDRTRILPPLQIENPMRSFLSSSQRLTIFLSAQAGRWYLIFLHPWLFAASKPIFSIGEIREIFHFEKIFLWHFHDIALFKFSRGGKIKTSILKERVDRLHGFLPGYPEPCSAKRPWADRTWLWKTICSREGTGKNKNHPKV